MFGKLGRSGGAGRGSGKRPLPTSAQLHRPNEAGGSRLPIGASAPPRARPVPQTLAAATLGREETFSLEPGKLDFGAIIRLTPDIVEEIKRLEAQGGAAKIKFDANANNSTGNVMRRRNVRCFVFSLNLVIADFITPAREREFLVA